ncbi:MAG: peptidase S9 [Vicinamibacterales bacterium]
MLQPSRVSMSAVLVYAIALTAAPPASAQYFGRNQVQHKQFEFAVLTTEHFQVHFYPEARDAAEETARMAERWYARLSQILKHDLSGPQPLILYASGPDFRQTNVVSGIGEGTGGVTEGLRRRIVMPVFGTLAETDHVLGHELVHAFQYDIASESREAGETRSGLESLPLWFVEGMAEYLSIGHVDPHTAMWIRDAAREKDKLPSIRQLDSPDHFPYRWGQAFWAYVAGRWGDGIVRQVLDEAIRLGPPTAIERVLGVKQEELSTAWHEAISALYAPALQAGTRASKTGRPLARDSKRENLAIAPSLSPDGRHVVYLSERDMLSIDMYLAEVETGRVVRRLTNTAIDPHFNSIQFLASAGAWHPGGHQFVFGAIRDGHPVLAIVDTDTGRRMREIPFPDLGEILNPTWSPDARWIAFSASTGGRSDLFVYDLTMNTRRQLTADAFADLQPAWSGDSAQLAFVTDRAFTDLNTLHAGQLGLAVLEVSSGRIELLPTFGRGKSINPQWAPGGRSLYFLSDATGVTDVYSIDVDSRRMRRLTRLDAGASGITAISPALSAAVDANRVAFTGYEEGRIGIYFIEGRDALSGVAVESTVSEDIPAAAMLPPTTRASEMVGPALADATTGLPAEVAEPAPYHARLGLNAVSQPYVSAGYGPFGGMFGGGIAMSFSDMLGNHNLYAAVDANTYGGFSDMYRNTGGLVAYTNLTRRWNWGLSAGQIPYLTGYTTARSTPSGFAEQEVIFRQTFRGADGRVSYPLSTARRVELGTGFQQISFDQQIRTIQYSRGGQFLGQNTERTSLGNALQMATATAAFVYDTSVFGATSPVSGQRSRLEVTPAFGSLDFATAIADYRRYFMPAPFYTLATRVIHYGRYGHDSESTSLYPLYLGYPEFIRGYGVGSFRGNECSAGPTGGTCEVYDRMLGSRLLVGNLELRFPLLRPFGVRTGMYGPVPIEMALFADGGVAWTDSQRPSLFGGERKPISSTGVSLRLNLFGFAVVQTDFAYPFQRAGRGWVWAFNLMPGF